ncbi:MAG: hypothetical protein KIT36_08980 [Alphaproteobacteria bacterium]|nr:hypothetical protein [Alphaproteobacteria bacterium]
MAPKQARTSAILRVAAICDVVVGAAIAIFGPAFVPVGDIVPGVPLLWLVGGLVAMGGVGIFVVSLALQRRHLAAAASDGTQPVRRD